MAYTYSKLIDNASEVFGVGATNLPQQAAFPSIFGGQAADRAVSFFDRTHRASITYVYALPWMKEQRGFVGRMAGGWEISGVTTWESGVPLTVVNGQDADGVQWEPTTRITPTLKPAAHVLIALSLSISAFSPGLVSAI